jgi:hypothetical protein
MASALTLIIEGIEVLTLVITILSGYYMSRQRTTSYADAKKLIVAVHVLFAGVISLEFARTVLATESILKLYVVFGTIFILLSVELLTVVAWSVYLPIHKSGIGKLLSGITRNKLHLSVFVGGTAYIVFVIGYLTIASPYRFQSSPLTNRFDPFFLGLLFTVLLLFMTYPTTLFMGARRRTTLPNVKNALILLPITWICIGLALLVFNAFPYPSGIDLLPVGYFIAALGLAATSTIFRRASLLAGFFEARKTDSPEELPVPSSQAQSTKPISRPFSKQLGLKEDSFSGRKFLLEVDSSTSYERAVNDFVKELSNLDYSVFVFTTRGSPIYNSLRSGRSRFYLLSTTVSYTTVSTVPTEVLVPQSDPAVLLDAIQKTIETDTITPIGIVFDSVSDFIVSLGMETSYKFLKKTLEAIDSDRITALFLMTMSAHEERETNLIKSLFSNQLRFGTKGFEVNRLA